MVRAASCVERTVRAQVAHSRMSSCEMRCRLRAFARAFRPHRARVLPKWHVVFLAFLVFLFSSFFQAWFSLEKRSNALPKWSPAPSRRRCQGAWFRVYGSAADALDRRSGRSRRSLHAGRADSAKDGRSRLRRYAKGRLDFGRFDQEIIFSVCDGKFWRGSPHSRYQQLFLLKFESIGFLLWNVQSWR